MTPTEIRLLQLERGQFHKSFNFENPEDVQRFIDYIRMPRYFIDANGNKIITEDPK